MRTRTGTGIVIALFLALSLLCSVSVVAQDNLLVTTTTNNKTGGVCSIAPTTNTTQALCTTATGVWSTTNPTVNCAAYALDGVTCIAGQYYHSDAVKPNTQWVGGATSTAFGPWVEGVTGSSSGCLSCHHGSITTAGRGGGYLVGGHKNILRKVVPGQTLFDTQGVAVANVIDHSSNKYTLSQTAGTISGTLGTFTANYLAGWVADGAIDVFGTNTNGTANTTLAYGSCARCHTTGYRWDGNAPEPTSVSGTTFTKLPAAFNYPAGQKSGDTTVATSWSLTGIQCERCHKADMQYDATVVNPNIGSVAAPVLSAGRISHLNNIIPTSVTADATTGKIAGTDFFISAPNTQTTSTRPLPNPPYALTCVECHQAYSTWTSKVAGTPGQVHLTPLPGFESLAPKASGNYSTTKDATGQFSATWGCVGATGTVATNDYNGCIAKGGTVTYVPGGMSHGAVATLLNSPHARVTGYVDIKKQNSADTTLSITGGTISDPTSLVNGKTFTGQYNTFFASTGVADQGAPAGNATATNGVSGSCAGCHDIHSYMPNYFEPVVNATNVDPTPLKNCTSCHASHGKAMNHPTGPGTPYSTTITGVLPTTSMGVGQQESCNICHFSKKTGTEYHFLRINADPNYNTFPTAQQYYTTTGSGLFGKLNTYPESYTNPVTFQPGTYPAVGLDVDIACGQCHTGGDGNKNPYGIVAYAGDGGVAPRPYSRAFLAAAAVSMHGTAANAPTFNVALPATGGPTTIKLSTSDVSEGAYAGIYYTTDGTVPSVVANASEQYVGTTASTQLCVATVVGSTSVCSIPVTATTTIYALAAGPATYSFSPSAVVGGTYGVQAAPAPSIVPTGAALTYPATVSVKLSDLAASVCYTTNLATPVIVNGACTNGITVASNSSIVVSQSEVIKAVAFGGTYGPGNLSTATFTVTPPTPAWSNVAPAKFPGTYTGAVTAVLTDADPNASICYTNNGTTPVAPCNGVSVPSGSAITVSASQTIKAIAIDGTSVSKATSGTYTIH
jgi:Chitobiase/beta-hexosaminidase C-terminal domain